MSRKFTPYKPAKPSSILIDARKLVDAGWIKGELKRTHEGKAYFCASGAIREAYWKTDDNGQASYKAREYAQHYTANLPMHEYNDRPKTTKEDILWMFDWAIAEALVNGD